jgi:hypothetical protein
VHSKFRSSTRLHARVREAKATSGLLIRTTASKFVTCDATFLNSVLALLLIGLRRGVGLRTACTAPNFGKRGFAVLGWEIWMGIDRGTGSAQISM